MNSVRERWKAAVVPSEQLLLRLVEFQRITCVCIV